MTYRTSEVKFQALRMTRDHKVASVMFLFLPLHPSPNLVSWAEDRQQWKILLAGS